MISKRKFEKESLKKMKKAKAMFGKLFKYI